MDSEYVERIARMDERSKSNTKRLDDHEDRIVALEKTYSIMEKMDYRMGNLESTVKNINEKLDKETAKDDKAKSKKWDKLIDYIFYCILGALMVVILTKLGLK